MVSGNMPGAKKATIVSFDVPNDERYRRNIIQRFLYGRFDTKRVNGVMRTYRYPGLLDEGGLKLGQSVFLLPPNLASRLILKLRELKIEHSCWDVLLPDNILAFGKNGSSTPWEGL